MPYLTRELVSRSFYLAGIVSQEMQTVSGYQINEGLALLNEFLAFTSADQRRIPYFTQYDFAGVIGQEAYFIDGLILPQSLTFELSGVRYPMNSLTRNEYFASSRANNINSLPYQYFVERSLSGSTLYMYFFPNQTYAFQLHGKFALTQVTLDQDLSLILDAFYLNYLRYGLAEYMCQSYQLTFSPDNKNKLDSMESIVMDISPMDLTVKKYSILQSGAMGLDVYGLVNISKGWVP